MRNGVYLASIDEYCDPRLLAELAHEAGDRSVGEQEETARYAKAGVVWWLEDLSTQRFDLDEARERLHKGPPVHPSQFESQKETQ